MSKSSTQLLEQLASAVVMADPGDVPTLNHILTLFDQLLPLWKGEEHAALFKIAAQSMNELKSLINGSATHRLASFNAVCNSVSSLQQIIRNNARKQSAPPPPAAPAPASAPPAAAAPPATIPLESAPAAKPPPAPAPAAKAAPPPAPAPAPAPAASPAPAPAAKAAPRRRFERDPETLELVADFLQEGNAGLDQADEILMAVEQEGLNPEKINALFRVFHSIKGVAGFLELGDVTSLAHITETLLNGVRDNELQLEGAALDVVFEATEMSRELLLAVRKGVETDIEVPAVAGLEALIQRIDTATREGQAAMAAGAAAPRSASRAPAPAANGGAPAPAAAPLAAVPALAAAPAAATESPEAAEMAPVAEKASDGSTKLRETVKVDLERVDQMVEMIGELIIVESMVVHAPEIASLGSLRLRRHLSQLTKISRDLQDIGMRMRMVPVRGVFQKMARLVRELSRKTNKKVVLVSAGETTEMDRSMVERIEDPLVHMIRNAVDHGIETPAERVAAGKDPEATIRLSAYYEGGSVVIEVVDNGRGLNRERILAKARAQKLVSDNDVLTDNEVNNLIFAPGFSTASQVTEISGRGVGMDVVKRNVEEMRGRVTIDSEFGRGTTFRLMLPLTLAVIDGMLVACGQERYIVPSLSIVESLKPTPGMVFTFAERDELVNVRGDTLPLLRASRLFNIENAQEDPTQALCVVVEGMGKKFVLLVDDVVTQQQVVIKPLSAGLENTDLYSGAAILSDGKVGLILNIDRLSSLIKRSGSPTRFSQEKVA